MPPPKDTTNLRGINWISADTVLSVLFGDDYSPGYASLADLSIAARQRGKEGFLALWIEADTGMWLKPVQYEPGPEATPTYLPLLLLTPDYATLVNPLSIFDA